MCCDKLFFSGPEPDHWVPGALCICDLPPIWYLAGEPPTWHLRYEEIEPIDTALYGRMVEVDSRTNLGDIKVINR